MNTIYIKKNYKIYSSKQKGCYIIHNTNKCFDKGHTHIDNFEKAIWLINLSLHKTIPKRYTKYILNSLLRISNSVSYRFKLETLLIELDKENECKT